MPRDEQGRSTNTFANVYGEMFVQVCLDCPNLGDFRLLTGSEIRFFYNTLRHRLKSLTKPK